MFGSSFNVQNLTVCMVPEINNPPCVSDTTLCMLKLHVQIICVGHN